VAIKQNELPCRLYRRIVYTIIALVLLFSSCLFYPCLSQAAVIDEIRDLLRNNYVDPVPQYVLNSTSIDEMLDRLDDPHTVYWTDEEYQNFIDSLNLNLSGIGISFEVAPDGALVISVLPGTPAETAGLLPGDIITTVNNTSLAGKSSEEMISLIRGPEGTTVNLVIKRTTGSINKTLTRAKIEVPTVTGELLDGNVGFIRINTFGENTAKDFDNVVSKLKGGKGWIIDLRNNGGGLVSTAQDLTGYFTGDQVMMVVKSRNGEDVYQANGNDKNLSPAVFLTNRYSASASEIMLAAIKDYGKASLIGENTYGKGTMQGIFVLSEGVLKMTVARTFSPLGKSIE